MISYNCLLKLRILIFSLEQNINMVQWYSCIEKNSRVTIMSSPIIIVSYFSFFIFIGVMVFQSHNIGLFFTGDVKYFLWFYFFIFSFVCPFSSCYKNNEFNQIAWNVKKDLSIGNLCRYQNDYITCFNWLDFT